MSEQAMSAPPGPTRGRGRQVGMDMVRSLGVVALLLLAWMLFAHPRTPDAVKSVDWWPVAQGAASAATYQVLAPPESFGWTATSARVEPQPDGTLVWRAGFYSPEEEYAGVLQRGVFPGQADGTAQQWIDQETRSGVPGEQVVIGGRTWVRAEGEPTPDERRSLVARDGGTVTVVTGSASWAELEQLAASLRPVAG